MLDVREAAHVAKLSRLEFGPEELERMTGELSAILTHVEKLGELNTDGVEADFAVLPGASCPLRQDQVHLLRRAHTREEILANAPEEEDGCFVVPRVLGL